MKDGIKYVTMVGVLIALGMILKPWLVITVAAWDLGQRWITKNK